MRFLQWLWSFFGKPKSKVSRHDNTVFHYQVDDELFNSDCDEDDYVDFSFAKLTGDPLPVEEAIAFMDDLFCELSAHIDSVVPMAWIGDATTEEAELWIYEQVSELLGGENDGTEVCHGYELDVSGLCEVLGKFSDGLETAGVDFTSSPEAAVELCGSWKDKIVFVRFLADPPPNARPQWLVKSDGSFISKPDEVDDAD